MERWNVGSEDGSANRKLIDVSGSVLASCRSINFLARDN